MGKGDGGLIPPLHKAKVVLDKNETVYGPRMDQIKFVEDSL